MIKSVTVERVFKVTGYLNKDGRECDEKDATIVMATELEYGNLTASHPFSKRKLPTLQLGTYFTETTTTTTLGAVK